MSYCTEIGPFCPVEATTYGYYPALGPNAALLAVYGTLFFAQVTIGCLTKVYWYTGAIAVGCALEAAGYGGRIMMHDNPWSESGMKLQIVCLILGPSFIAGGIYFTLKHLILQNGPEYSRLKPKFYTWIFIGCDVGSLFLQAIGGGLAAAAETKNAMLEAGNNIIITGIAFQVATMLVCGILAADYSLRRFRMRDRSASSTTRDGASVKAMMFQAAVFFAYITVLIRCIYRLPEMAGGWGNPRMRNEPEFLTLDGLMIALACASLTIFHPGFFYPYMRTGYSESHRLVTPPMEMTTPSFMSTDNTDRK